MGGLSQLHSASNPGDQPSQPLRPPRTHRQARCGVRCAVPFRGVPRCPRGPTTTIPLARARPLATPFTLNIWNPIGPESRARLPRSRSTGAAPGWLTQPRCPGNLSPPPGQKGQGAGASAQARGRQSREGVPRARGRDPRVLALRAAITPGQRVGGVQSPGRPEEEEAAPGDRPAAGVAGGRGAIARPVAPGISKARGHTPSSRSAAAFGDAANPALRGGAPLVPAPAPCPGYRASRAPSRISLPPAPPRTCDSPGGPGRGCPGVSLLICTVGASWGRARRLTPPVWGSHPPGAVQGGSPRPCDPHTLLGPCKYSLVQGLQTTLVHPLTVLAVRNPTWGPHWANIKVCTGLVPPVSPGENPLPAFPSI
uniref:collagen alpha-1(III) chain-like n=1 Tax=Callithrix jacchus TaxID=9483 RepID=UPI0023DD64FB|nr:collagen alpha-1(III) chain-like [Callithrix jacchus]